MAQLQAELGSDQWTAIAHRLGRSAPSVRNRFTRNRKAADLKAAGKAKNRCTVCREYLMGSHVCKKKTQDSAAAAISAATSLIEASSDTDFAFAGAAADSVDEGDSSGAHETARLRVENERLRSTNACLKADNDRLRQQLARSMGQTASVSELEQQATTFDMGEVISRSADALSSAAMQPLSHGYSESECGALAGLMSITPSMAMAMAGDIPEVAALAPPPIAATPASTEQPPG